MTPLLGENLADWLGNNGWAIWFSVALLLAIAEILSLDLVLIMLAIGALAGGITAAFVPSLWWLQILVAVVVSVLTLLLVRPTVMKRVHNLPGYRSSFASIVGKEGRVTEEVTAAGGAVKIDGQAWSARAYDDDMVIGPGTEVEVFELDGAVVVVYPRNLPLTDGGSEGVTL